MASKAYIVSAFRTAAGKKNGKLARWHPADLGAVVINRILQSTKIDGALVDDVIFGCVSQVGAQGANLARNVVLNSDLPVTVPGTTVDRQCGSSLQAIHFAAQAVMSGTQDVVIAGGVECMSSVVMGSNMADGKYGWPNGKFTREKYGNKDWYSQFVGAEMMGKKYNITREEMDIFAASSHAKASLARKEGRFDREIVSVTGFDKSGAEVTHDFDEGIRPDTTVEKLAALEPLAPGGRITAGNASQISDGAAAIMVCNENGLKKLGLKPRAVISHLALAGTDPVLMLSGPIPATESVLKRANLSVGDIDCFEVNEAFASVSLAWQKQLGADINRLNVNGGACALGHPLGGTGAKLMTTLLHELERSQKKRGLIAICEGGGTANATIIERC